MMHSTLLGQLEQGSAKALARAMTLVESEAPGYEALLSELPQQSGAKIVGITGPPGAGKSSLADSLIGHIVKAGKRVAVLCVDPSSPFHFGALLGDRIRMSAWYTHPQVFIRSLASRGSLGGLHPKAIELTELAKAAHFDYVLIETVGVGQSEVEVAGLADITLVVLVPESGDEVQSLKAGLMEIGDAFVVNKADRPGADAFVKHLGSALSFSQTAPPIFKTIAHTGEGVEALFHFLENKQENALSQRRLWLLAEKVYGLVQRHRMRTLPKETIIARLQTAAAEPHFNVYRFAQSYFQ